MHDHFDTNKHYFEFVVRMIGSLSFCTEYYNHDLNLQRQDVDKYYFELEYNSVLDTHGKRVAALRGRSLS